MGDLGSQLAWVREWLGFSGQPGFVGQPGFTGDRGSQGSLGPRGAWVRSWPGRLQVPLLPVPGGPAPSPLSCAFASLLVK